MTTASEAKTARPSLWFRIWDSEVFYSFRNSHLTVAAAIVTLLLIVSAVLADWIAPHKVFDTATIDLLDAELPPSWVEGGDPRFLLGTDNLGRDILSTILYGMQISLMVGFASVLLSAALGIVAGLVAGYVGGRVDAVIMRIADIQLSFPTILIALLVDGVSRGVVPREQHDAMIMPVLILSIGVSNWVQYARTVRGSTLVERNKEYVQAARVIGLHPMVIMIRHVLPNVMGPVLVIATLGLAFAILTEATLSFLGVGMPPTQPSLGTLISIGNDFLFSGLWWITLFPGLTLAVLVLAVNLMGDWLRDALNPKLR